jgi:alpha-beta hydrolase superfamily lysophospholipase
LFLADAIDTLSEGLQLDIRSLRPIAATTGVAADLAYTSAQANAFEAGVPTARVVRLPNADHDIFISNEADVLREMNDFLAKVSN